MPLDKTCDKAAVGRNISMLVREKKPQKQAIAIALSVLRRACGMKDGKAKGERKTATEIVGEERAERCGSVAVSLAHLPSRKKLRKKKRPVKENGDFIQHVVDMARKHGVKGEGTGGKLTPAQVRKLAAMDEEGFGLAGPPKIYNPNRVPSVKRGKRLPIHRNYNKNIRSRPFIDPEDYGLRYIPVESLFREGQGPDFVAVQGPGRGVGLSPSASTTKKPTDRKRKKVRVAPTREN